MLYESCQLQFRTEIEPDLFNCDPENNPTLGSLKHYGFTVDRILELLVGGLKHFLISIIYGIIIPSD
jgi:hypothetical protein